MRVNMMDDTGEDHVVGEAEELFASGLSSPTPLRWHRLNIRLTESLSVFVKVLPPGESSDPDVVR
jgi:hypothetical protein